MKTRDLQVFKKFDNFPSAFEISASPAAGLVALLSCHLVRQREVWTGEQQSGKQVENWRLIEGAADQQVVSWHWQPPKLVAGDNFSFRSFWGLKCNYQPQQMLTLMYIALMYYIAVKQFFFSESLSDQLTRMPNSSVCLSVLSVTKNPGHFSSYCIYQTWSNGFLQSFKQYFSPPDFDIS